MMEDGEREALFGRRCWQKLGVGMETELGDGDAGPKAWIDASLSFL